jgi:acetyltransferase-like isoleucine patch superfamily enzyme
MFPRVRMYSGILAVFACEEISMPKRLECDWFGGSISDNVFLAADVYVDSTFGFAAFFSERQPGLRMGRASGIYDRATLIVGPRGAIDIGEFACLNGVYVICNGDIAIGSHTLLGWGSVITDTVADKCASISDRRATLEAAARDPRRILPPMSPPVPIVLEENVWIGFDSVILPGVRVGKGSIIGCKTVVADDVPPYSIVAGNPARLLRTLEPDVDEEPRAEVFARCIRET